MSNNGCNPAAIAYTAYASDARYALQVPGSASYVSNAITASYALSGGGGGTSQTASFLSGSQATINSNNGIIQSNNNGFLINNGYNQLELQLTVSGSPESTIFFNGENALYEDLIGINSNGDFILQGDDSNAGAPYIKFEFNTGNIDIYPDVTFGPNPGVINLLGNIQGATGSLHGTASNSISSSYLNGSQTTITSDGGQIYSDGYGDLFANGLKAFGILMSGGNINMIAGGTIYGSNGPANFSGSMTGSLNGTSSYATNVINNTATTLYTASTYPITASYALNTGSSFNGTSSLFGTSSWSNIAITSSYLSGSSIIVTSITSPSGSIYLFAGGIINTASLILDTQGNLSGSNFVGNVISSISQINGNFNINISKSIYLVNTLSSSITGTLPNSIGLNGFEFVIKDWKGNCMNNPIIINGINNQTIDGNTGSFILNYTNYASINILSDGQNWCLV